MEQHIEFEIVDVFAETPRTGNQLAVIRNAAGLSAAAMQSIAREFDFSETTFVGSHADGRARVRIFTPGQELPFAGHPTLGTAWVLTRGTGAITLALDAGDVPVTFGQGIAWMTPPATQLGDVIDRSQAAQFLGLPDAEIDTEIAPIAARCGPSFAIIGVRSHEALARATMQPPSDRRIDGAAFIFCRGGYSSDADFAARMLFFDGTSVREDPATGSANSAFAAYLRSLAVAGNLTVEQGFEIGRASRIYLDIGPQLRVGGRVQAFASGKVHFGER
jgi:trans-2,3-dihydro-3-hydroxyanthranilate isomerase